MFSIDRCKMHANTDSRVITIPGIQICRAVTIELAGSISQSVRQLIAGIDMTILYFDTNDGIDTELWVLILLSIDLIRTTRDMAFS